MVTSREWRRVLLYALLLALLTSIPYWLAWRAAGDDYVFRGFLFGGDDGHSYIAKMRLGAQGLWDFYLFYTAEEHNSAGLLFLPYIIPGQITRLFISETDPALTPLLIGIYHLMRVVFGVLLVLVLYRFIAEFLRSGRSRFLALILATAGGGFGWLLIFAGELPPEFFIPEDFTFLILIGLPHLALARACLLLGIILLNRQVTNSVLSPQSSVLIGFLWLIVGLAVPFYLVILYAILGAWGIAAWIRARAFPTQLFIHAVIAAGITLPLFLYNVIVFSTNPAFAQFSAQNLLPSPPLLHYILAYLPFVLLAIVGARWAWRRGYVLLVGLPLIVPLLIYLPVNVQRRMAEAIIVPLSILVSAGIMFLARRMRRPQQTLRASWRRLVIPLLLLVFLPSTLALYLGNLAPALVVKPPLFHPNAEIAAYNWLNQHAAPREVVLSAFATGNQIPAYTHLRVYVGHGPETMFAVAKERETERFFGDEMSADERAELYQTMRIRYVFYGAEERELALNIDAPEWAQGLNRIYAQDDYEVYEIPR